MTWGNEKRELASRMAVLLAHLLKWGRQSNRPSWRATIIVQRKRIALALKETPSLKAVMRDRDWQDAVWLDALAQACKETDLRKRTCRKPARGRWSRRLIRGFGRSEEGGAVKMRRLKNSSGSAPGRGRG